MDSSTNLTCLTIAVEWASPDVPDDVAGLPVELLDTIAAQRVPTATLGEVHDRWREANGRSDAVAVEGRA